MAAHYDAVDYATFSVDLADKDQVILLRDADATLCGFTTLKRYRLDHPAAHDPIRVLFSGDTVIDRRHWGSQVLAFAWIELAGQEKGRHPAEPLFWFLISKGPRTYRYLSAFSRSYWPHHALPTPCDVSALMHSLAVQRFGADYYPDRGVVHFPASRGHLRHELSAVGAADLRRPEVQFFLRANPGYVHGDELVCLTELSSGNLKPLARRVFEKGLRHAEAKTGAPCLATPA
jgi:hypothetical protein